MIDIFQTLLKSRMGGLEEVEEMGGFFANAVIFRHNYLFKFLPHTACQH